MSLTSDDRFGHYQILASLGSGGMGEVYRAHDPRLGREVAIKVIRPAAASSRDAHARLWREARAAASVNHPSICQVYDIGEIDGQVFLVMELLTGESLADRLRDGPMPLEEAVGVAQSMLGGLAAVHGRQIVHRDLKPSNVFLTETGVKLLDFGLARAQSTGGENLVITQTGTVVGTPRYMAPELWAEGRFDPRSDLFAVGAILFEMLSGAPAFGGTDLMQVYHAVMTTHPPALAGSSAVAAVDAVIHRALEKRPDDRFQSAAAMAEALRAASTSSTHTSVTTVRRTTRLMAVPFRMLRPDPDVDFLSVSLPDAILGSLAGIQSLVVRSTLAGAGDTRESGLDLKKITDEGVDVVLSGTLLRSGNQIRLNAQLVEAATGTLLWSKTVQLALDDIFEVQDQLARAIVESLSIPLSTGEQRAARRDLPASARAYEFYLRGNQLAYDSSMLPVAGEMYRSSLEEDPDFAPAWARLGRVHRLLAKYGGEAPDTHLQRADDAFRRALEINPDLSIAHNLYTNFEVEALGRSREAMRRLLERARTQSPDPELYAGLVLACRFCGLLEASLAADRQARRLDPAVRTSVMHTYFALGDWERAIATDSDALRWVTKWTLPLIGRTEEAIAAYQAIDPQGLPPLVIAMMNGQRYVLENRRGEAIAALRGAGHTMDPEARYACGRAAARLGEFDLALGALAKSVEGGYFCLASIEADPWLEPLRGDRRFEEIRVRAAAGRQEAAETFTRLGGEKLLGL